ncbi:MAG: hypothetical protein E3K32_05160 [wastewater metagenome]|nr:hypothetical protein [Candidatus Loosdrechtia aerotolerans]
MDFLFSSEKMGLKLGIALCCAAVLYGVALSPDILGFYHDDGVYAVTAKALAEGKGYRIISLPGSPVQMTYPVLYPAVLSVVWRMFPHFPENIVALKIPSIIFSVLFLLVTYFYLVRRNYASPRMALAIVIMTAFNPWMVWAATMAMSEALYCLVSVLALWMVEMFVSGTRDYRRFKYLPLAGMAIAVSLMTRSIGFSILLSTFIYLFLDTRRGPKDRRQKEGAINHQSTLEVSQSAREDPQSSVRYLRSPDRRTRETSLFRKGFVLATQLELTVLVFLSPWLVWTFLQYVSGTHLETYPYRPVFYGSYSEFILWQWRDYGFLFFFEACLYNLYQCIFGVIPNLLLPGVDIKNVYPLNFISDYLFFGGTAILGLCVSALAIISMSMDFYKGRFSLITVYVLLVLIVVLFWPVIPDRFLVPVLPFVLLLFLKGLSLFSGKLSGTVFLRRQLHRVAGSVLIAVVFLNSGLALACDSQKIFRAKTSEEWEQKERLFHWIKENTHDGDVLAISVSPALYLYTNRKAIPSIIGIDANDSSAVELSDNVVMENFKNLLDYTEVGDLYLVKINHSGLPAYERMIDRLAIKYHEQISLVYTGKDMKYAIYKME